MHPLVVIAEDDAEVRAILVEGLRDDGFAAEGVATAAALLEAVARRAPDVIVLDIGLPDGDGRDVCHALRAQGLHTPVLFLTALDALPDRISSFRAGGDDYVSKPFALVEVAERLRALVRRGGGAGGRLEVSGLRLDPAAHAVQCRQATVRLTPTEFRLLAALLAAPGAAVRRRTLKEAGWPHGALVHDNMLDAFVARVRRKLRQLPDAPSIRTLPGVGYSIET